MKKKLLFGLLIFTLVALPLLAACAEEEAPAPAPAPAPTPEPEVEVMELRLAGFMPPMSPQPMVYEEWAGKIQEATNGMVQITYYPAASLIGEEDVMSGIKAGIADMGDLTLSGMPERFPLTLTMQLPFIPISDAEAGYNMWIKLENQFPEMQAELEGFKVLFRTTTATYALHTAEGPIKTPEDLEGLKLFAPPGPMMQVMEEIGASPMFLPVTEFYTSLERGLIEGMWMNWQAVYELGCYPFLPYHTVFPSGLYIGQIVMLMNLDTWNALPPDVQQVFEELGPWATERVRELAENEASAVAIAAMQEEGHTITTLTPDEEKVWYEAATAAREAYLAEVEAMGLPANAVYEEVLRLAEQ